MKPQGKTGTKRTPTSAFDGAAGKDIYEPEKICAQRLAKPKGVTQWMGKSQMEGTKGGDTEAQRDKGTQ